MYSFLTVDIGEEKPRTVCSGLVKHVPMEQLQVSCCHYFRYTLVNVTWLKYWVFWSTQDKMVVMLCNLKPAK